MWSISLSPWERVRERVLARKAQETVLFVFS
jgi:hypothetical protein